MPTHVYQVGESVAIMPSLYATDDTALEIAIVNRVEDGLVHLRDGRIYDRWCGMGVTILSHGNMVPATDAHRAALAKGG